MKTIKESFLENALMFIMVGTLVITCVGWGGKFSHNNNSDEFASYGYVPQYAMDTEQHASVQVAKNIIHSTTVREDSSYRSMSGQYAADVERRALAFRDTARVIIGSDESSYGSISGQYASDVEQRTLVFRDSKKSIQ